MNSITPENSNRTQLQNVLRTTAVIGTVFSLVFLGIVDNKRIPAVCVRAQGNIQR